MHAATLLIASSLFAGGGSDRAATLSADTLGYCSAVYVTSLDIYAANTRQSTERDRVILTMRGRIESLMDLGAADLESVGTAAPFRQMERIVNRHYDDILGEAEEAPSEFIARLAGDLTRCKAVHQLVNTRRRA